MRCDVRIKGQQEGRNGGLQHGAQVAIETQDDEENMKEKKNGDGNCVRKTGLYDELLERTITFLSLYSLLFWC